MNEKMILWPPAWSLGSDKEPHSKNLVQIDSLFALHAWFMIAFSASKYLVHFII